MHIAYSEFNEIFQWACVDCCVWVCFFSLLRWRSRYAHFDIYCGDFIHSIKFYYVWWVFELRLAKMTDYLRAANEDYDLVVMLKISWDCFFSLFFFLHAWSPSKYIIHVKKKTWPPYPLLRRESSCRTLRHANYSPRAKIDLNRVQHSSNNNNNKTINTVDRLWM